MRCCDRPDPLEVLHLLGEGEVWHFHLHVPPSLTSGGHAVVVVGQLVRQLLEVVRLQVRGVLVDIVAGGVDCALSDKLRD